MSSAVTWRFDPYWRRKRMQSIDSASFTLSASHVQAQKEINTFLHYNIISVLVTRKSSTYWSNELLKAF
jgi:hypothetical protein